MSKRHSILPPVAQQGPKPPVKLSSSLTIADSAILIGTHSIIVMAETVIHPRCRIESTAGSVLVGKRCIIHERTHIGAGGAEGAAGGVALGDYVTVEVGAVIEAGGTDVGEGTVIGIGAKIGAGAKIGKNCTITPKVLIAPGEVIPDYTVVCSNNMRRTDRRDINDTRHKAICRQIEVLRRLIPSNPAKFQ